MRAETKYKGSIKLSAIGDALGWMTEFEKDTQSLKKKFGVDRIEEFHTWKKTVGGRFYGYIDSIKAGSYSDDTQLLLAVARCINADGSLNHEFFAKEELSNWLDYARGGGRTVKNAAEKIQRKSANWYQNFFTYKVNNKTIDYRDMGANGAAMRVLPIALANFNDIEKIKKEIFKNSIATHGHPRALVGAMLYGYAINEILDKQPDSFNWENYITQIGLNFPEKFELTFLDSFEIKTWLQEWNKTPSKSFEIVYNDIIVETQQYLRLIYQSIKHNYEIRDTLDKLGCFASATKGSGTSTVLAGIYLASKFYNNPLDAIITAVNALGTDTDSIAAFTGGLVGALHGQSIIPQKWKSIQDLEYLDKIANRLLAISEDRHTEQNLEIAEDTQLQLLNSPSIDDYKINQKILFNPLGKGIITNIDRQNTRTKGKYNLIVEANLDNGQSIIVTKIFNIDTSKETFRTTEREDIARLLQKMSKTLQPQTFATLKTYLTQLDNIDTELLNILQLIIEDKK